MTEQSKDYKGPVFADHEDPFDVPGKERRPRAGHTFDVLEPLPPHLQPPPPPPQLKRPRREMDVGETGFKVKAAMWSLPGAPVVGLAVMGAFTKYPAPIPIIAAVLALPVGWFLSYKLVLHFSEGAGKAAASIYFHSGESTPSPRQYSLAQSYVARGMYSKAAEQYAVHAAEYPTDPEPCMRLARLYRDELDKPEEAIQWFKHTSLIEGINPGTEMMALRELIEVYTHRLHRERAAAPYLARLAAAHPNAPAGVWAKQQLAAMKAAMREDSPSVDG